MYDHDETYWASRVDEELVSAVYEKIREFHEDLETLGIKDVLDRCYAAYYGGELTSYRNGRLFDSNRLNIDGGNGELTTYKSNHLRNVLQYTLNLTTANKQAFAARATNTDSKSQAQTILANGVVDYYWREKNITPVLRSAAETALVQFEGWVHYPWKATAGKLYDQDPITGSPIYEGDTVFKVFPMIDIVRDPKAKESPWKIVRDEESKWDLLARYPDLAEKLNDLERQENWDEPTAYGMRNFTRMAKSDFLTKWIFYHERTEALPEGRVVEIVGDVVVSDSPLPYRKIPLAKLSAGQILGTPYSYSQIAELVGPQQALDMLNNIIMTNQAAAGVQMFWTQTGDNVQTSELKTGLVHIQSAQKPEGVTMVATAPEIFKNRDAVKTDIEQLSGINSTVRGEPPNQATSGASQALLVSQAIQFSSALETGFDQLAEEIATGIIWNTQDFSKTKRVATIVGASNRPFLKDYQSEDLDQVDRVAVEKVNPLSKTISGRVQMAETLLQYGQITATQYASLLEHGNLKAITEDIVIGEINIKSENEDLRNGLPVMAILTDLHADHIKAHKSVIESPEDRRNPELVNAVLSHIQEHLDLWRQTDPAILMVTGQQPPPPPPQPMAPEMGRPAPGGPPPQTSEILEEQNQAGSQPDLPSMPSLPDQAPEQSQQAYETSME